MDTPSSQRPKAYERIIVAPRGPDMGVTPVQFDMDRFKPREGPRHAHVHAHALWAECTFEEALQLLAHRGQTAIPEVDRIDVAPLDGRHPHDLQLRGNDLTLPLGSIVIRRPGQWRRQWIFPCCRVSYAVDKWTQANRHLWSPPGLRDSSV